MASLQRPRFLLEACRFQTHEQEWGRSYLIHDIKVLPHGGGRHGAEVILQYIHKRLQEGKGKNRIH